MKAFGLLVACMATGGCNLFGGQSDDAGRSRCEQDRYDCQDRTDVPAVEGCALDGELSVEIGHGLTSFSALDDGEALPTYSVSGGFQGPGVAHTSLGLRIGEAALDRYDVLGARLSVYERGACTTMSDVDLVCDGVAWIGDRSVLLGDGPALNIVDGIVEEFGLTMPLEPVGPGSYVLEVLVQDPCGQVGIAHHEYTL